MTTKPTEPPFTAEIDLERIRARFAPLLDALSPEFRQDFQTLLALADQGRHATTLVASIYASLGTYASLGGPFGEGQQPPKAAAAPVPKPVPSAATKSTAPAAQPRAAEARDTPDLTDEQKDQLRLDYIRAMNKARAVNNGAPLTEEQEAEIRSAQIAKQDLEKFQKGRKFYAGVISAMTTHRAGFVRRILAQTAKKHDKNNLLNELAEFFQVTREELQTEQSTLTGTTSLESPEERPQSDGDSPSVGNVPPN